VIFFVYGLYVLFFDGEDYLSSLASGAAWIALYVILFWGGFHVSDKFGFIGFGEVCDSIGKIENIKNIEVEYGPKLAVTVSYEDVKREINWINSDFLLHFNVGDFVVVEYNKKNKMRSRLNISKSIKLKNNRTHGFVAGSKFQVESILKQPMVGFYRLNGIIVSGDYSGRDISMITLLDSDKAERMQPGSVIDCNVSEFDGELV